MGMATTFETTWLEAARDDFLAIFGQTIIYDPSGVNRSITAIVKYIQDDESSQPVIRHKSPKVQIKVANDSTIGISAAEFGDNQIISVPPRPGATARNFNLARIVKCNGIWVTFECK